MDAFLGLDSSWLFSFFSHYFSRSIKGNKMLNALLFWQGYFSQDCFILLSSCWNLNVGQKFRFRLFFLNFKRKFDGEKKDVLKMSFEVFINNDSKAFYTSQQLLFDKQFSLSLPTHALWKNDCVSEKSTVLAVILMLL